MLFLRRPTDRKIRELLDRHGAMPFSYAEVGATRSGPPTGYRINHMRARVGNGKDVHSRAVKALFEWQLLGVGGIEAFPADAPVRPGTKVAMLSRHFGLWSLDFCRVIYVLNREQERHGAIERTGFAYGTLPGHAVRGEEIFSIEWHPASSEVWYEIFSFSQPANLLIRLASPLARRAQRRFAAASLRAAQESGSQQ